MGARTLQAGCSVVARVMGSPAGPHKDIVGLGIAVYGVPAHERRVGGRTSATISREGLSSFERQSGRKYPGAPGRTVGAL